MDAVGHEVTLGSGESIKYSKLLIATGYNSTVFVFVFFFVCWFLIFFLETFVVFLFLIINLFFFVLGGTPKVHSAFSNDDVKGKVTLFRNVS